MSETRATAGHVTAPVSKATLTAWLEAEGFSVEPHEASNDHQAWATLANYDDIVLQVIRHKAHPLISLVARTSLGDNDQAALSALDPDALARFIYTFRRRAFQDGDIGLELDWPKGQALQSWTLDLRLYDDAPITQQSLHVATRRLLTRHLELIDELRLALTHGV